MYFQIVTTSSAAEKHKGYGYKNWELLTVPRMSFSVIFLTRRILTILKGLLIVQVMANVRKISFKKSDDEWSLKMNETDRIHHLKRFTSFALTSVPVLCGEQKAGSSLLSTGF